MALRFGIDLARLVWPGGLGFGEQNVPVHAGVIGTHGLLGPALREEWLLSASAVDLPC
jgi:hypothetical protein